MELPRPHERRAHHRVLGRLHPGRHDVHPPLEPRRRQEHDGRSLQAQRRVGGRDEIGTFEEKGYIYILLFFCGLIIRRFKKPRLKWLGSVTSAHIHTYVKNVFIFWSVIWYGFCTIHEVGEKKM